MKEFMYTLLKVFIFGLAVVVWLIPLIVVGIFINTVIALVFMFFYLVITSAGIKVLVDKDIL